jgi:uncharacterized protein
MPSAVRVDPAFSRFELDADGATAVANYKLDGNVTTFTHTETPEAARCGGIASRLIEGPLQAVRASGLKDRAALLVRARLSRPASGISRPSRVAPAWQQYGSCNWSKLTRSPPSTATSASTFWL